MRNNALDLAKLVACGLVVSLHLAGFPEFPEWVTGAAGIIARWAVPFFFLISGYYLANRDAGALFSKIQKIIKMLLFGSFLYLVFIFANNHFSIDAVITQGLGFSFFIRGSFVHLWFLCALVYGCLIMSLFLGKERSAFPSLLALVIAVSYWLFDMLNSTGEYLYFVTGSRILLSFSMMWLGYLLAKYKHEISATTALSVIVVSLVMMYAEVYFLHIQYGYSPGSRQFPLFCIPLSYGIFMLCLASNSKENIFSRAGRDYSLGIYIVHYLWIYVFYYTLPSGYHTPSLLMIPLVLAASTLSLMFLRRYAHRVFMMLNGL